jgi:transposase
LELLDQLDPKIVELTAAVEQEANQRPEVLLLRTHPGVGPITGLAYVLVIGTPERFPSGKQIGSYVDLIPCEDSNAGRQRLGHISKQGNAPLRFCWWKQRRRPHGVTQTGGVGICTDDAPGKGRSGQGHLDRTRSHWNFR